MIFEFPLIRREFVVEVLRTKRAFFLVLIAVLISSGLTLLAWPSRIEPVGMGMENVMTVVLFLETQLTAAILIIPAFTAGAIAGERERGTYDLLHASLLSPRAVVFSKALASTGIVFILLAAAAPMACALYLVGGVTFESFLQGYAVTVASVVLSAAICLYASKRSERTARAAVRGVAGIIFWNGGLFFLVFLVLYSTDSRPPDWWPFLFSMCPHAAMAVNIFGSSMFGRMTLPFEPWMGSVSYSAILSAFYLALVLIPSRLPETAGSGAPKRPVRSFLRRRSLLTRLLLLIGEEGTPWNPIFLKEIRSEFFGRRIYRGLTFWGSLILFVWIAAVCSGWEQALLAVFTVATVLAVLLAPAVTASAFPREIEQGNIDFLRGTLLGFRSILRGKLLAALYSVSGIVLAAVIACFPAFFKIPGAFHSLSVLLVALFTAMAMSLTASAFARKTLTALVGAYGAVLVWLIVWPILLLLIGGAVFFFKGDWILMATSPFMALKALEQGSLGSILGFHLIHLGASVILVLWAGHRLEVSRSRDP